MSWSCAELQLAGEVELGAEDLGEVELQVAGSGFHCCRL